MANSELSQQQIDQISRMGIKKLIGKYSRSQGKDQQSLTMLLEQLAKTLLQRGAHFDAMTGGRIKRVQPYIGAEPFMMTYGDGVCDVNISKLVKFHQSHGKIATLTAVMLEQQKGILDIGGDNAVHAFREKSICDGAPINAGFMVLKPEIFDYIEGDSTVFERKPLERLAAQGELMSYMHRGYWQCMDTKREMDMLENLWQSGHAPWKVWED